MSDPNDAPAAAWYPDPQTPGQVRWWDGTNWTEHVSVPAQAPAPAAAATVAPSLPQAAGADTGPAAAVAEHVTYIGRHAAGPQPAPREPSTAPRIRPRMRVERSAEALSYA